MSFVKVGTPEKISEVIKDEKDFNELRNKIAKDNNLIRCTRCQHLLAKQGNDGELDIQHKKLEITLKKADIKGAIKCPYCNQIVILASEEKKSG